MGDTTAVGSADIFLKRAVLSLSVALVVLLTGVALYSLISTDDPDDGPDLTVPEEPAGPTTVPPFPGQLLEIDDSEFPLTIGCIRDRTAEDLFLVVIRNGGASPVDYLVSASLTAEGGASVEALATVDNLLPNEERQVVLRPEADIANPNRCFIDAVQGDRRVLLRG